MPRTLRQLLLWLFPAVVGFYYYGTSDLWNDEIYTLKQFVLRGPAVIVSDYHVPNNHVFANVLHWVWTWVTGITLQNYLDHPALLRIWPAFVSLLTLWVLYKAAELLAGADGGFWAVLLSLCTVGFHAFAFQIRGYPLTVLLTSVVLFLALKISDTNHKAWVSTQHVGLAGAVAGLLWCIPSNLYWVVALLAGVALWGLLHRSRWQVAAGLGVWILLGVGAAALLYLPIMAQLTGNRYAVPGPSFQAAHYENALNTYKQWAGTRWPLLAVALLVVAYRAVKRQHLIKTFWIAVLTLAASLPCVLIAWRGDAAPMRSYWVLFSSAVLVLSWLMVQALKSQPVVLKTVAIAACLGAFCYDLWSVRQRLAGAFTDKIRYQDINYNYYQHFFAPNAELAEFQRRFPGRQLVLEDHEPHDMPDYLAHQRIPYLLADSLNYEVPSGDSIWVSTRFAENYIRWMREDKGWACACMQPEIRYPRIVICRKQ
jgi:hypothetical protein